MKKQLTAQERIDLLKQHDEQKKRENCEGIFLNKKSGKFYTCIGYKDASKMENVGYIYDRVDIKFDPYTVDRIVAYPGDPFDENFIKYVPKERT